MRQLWLFLSNNHLFLLFILLEVVAFSLLLSRNDYHNSKFLHSYSGVTGSMLSKRAAVSDYFSLNRTNKELATENAQLRSTLQKYILDTIEAFPGEDSTLIAPVTPNEIDLTSIDTVSSGGFTITPAKVISNIGANKPYITINKGSKHGVKKESGVITGVGIVGKVVGVSKRYSLIMPVLHKNSRINVQHLKSGFNGNLVWDGRTIDAAQVENIPRNARINIGDTISSNSYSKAFSEGMPAAIVEKLDYDPTGNFYQLQVRLITDFRKLNYVYVTTLKDMEEILELENSIDE